MDRYEYQVCADQIKALTEEKRFAEAMDIADTIDWRRVKSFSMLCTVSEIYKINKHYEESRDILLLAYERYPDRANVVYALCELDIKLNNLKEAKEFYKEYYALKPHDNDRYVLLYRLYEAMGYSLEDKIALLEEFKRAEYTAKWAYELAYLYHQTGQESKCVEICDELILWFGDGPYVRKAMELKMQHAALSEEQQRKYDGVASAESYISQEESYPNQTGPIAKAAYESMMDSAPIQSEIDNPQYQQDYNQYNQPMQQQYQQGYDQYGQPMQQQYQQGYDQYGQPMQQQYQQGYDQYGQPIQQYNQGYEAYSGIQVQPVNTDKYSTINLQEELAKNMQEFYDHKGGQTVSANYYGETAPLYELSQQEYQERLNSAGAIVEEEPAPAVMPMPTMTQTSVEVPKVDATAPTGPIANEAFGSEPMVQEPIVQAPVVQEPVVQASVVQEPAVQPPKSLDKVLAQEYDGQISLSLPDPDMEVKQITGQIDISDFLKEWEEKKQSAKQHSMEEARKRQMEQTNDIMSQLVGVIPGLELSAVEEEKKAEPIIPIEEVVKSDSQETVTKTTISAPSYAVSPTERTVKRTETGTIINGPHKSGITGVIPDVLPSAGEKKSNHDAEDEKPAPIKVPDYIMAKEPIVAEPVVAEPVAEEPEEITEEPIVAEPVVAEPVAEEPEEITEEPIVAEPVVAEPVTEEPEEIAEEPIVAEPVVAEPITEESEEAMEESAEEESVEEEPIKYPFQVTDFGEAEEIEDIEQPDEVDDMLKTGAIPLFDIEQANYEAGIEEEEKRPAVPSYMVLDEKREAKRDFDEDEMRIFGRFEGIESLKAQIVDVMDDMSMEAARGNVVVTGLEINGRKSLAIDIVKAIQIMDSNFSGKVAKISGEALNKKDIPMTLHKLHNGALIVENAGGLTPVTVNIITESLLNGAEPILVVLEDEKDALEPLLSGCKEMKTVFGARIEMDPFSNEDYVSYAKGYAREQEYSIDEMGELALHTRISDLQTSIDDVVTVDDVKDIVDAAIRHVDRKTMSHFMDVLLAKRYDDDDYIVLREKDFVD